MPEAPTPDHGLAGMPEGILAIGLVHLARGREGGVVFVARSEARAQRLAGAATDLAPGLEVLVLPAWDVAPGDRAAPSRSVLGRRAAVLSRLATAPRAPRLLLAPTEAALQLMPPPECWSEAGLALHAGMTFDEEALRLYLVRAGYILDERVDEPGEAAIRGAVAEMFPAGAKLPVRCDIADGTLRQIRTYDPVSQRSEGAVESVELLPVSEILLTEPVLDRLVGALAERAHPDPDALRTELLAGRRPFNFDLLLPWAYPRLASLFDYLPGAAFLPDTEAGERAAAYWEQVAEGREAGLRAPADIPLPDPWQSRLDAAAWSAGLAGHPALPLEGDGGPAQSVAPAGSLRAAIRQAAARLDEGMSVVIACGSTGEAERLSAEAGAALGREVALLPAWPEALPPHSCAVMTLRLAEGFVSDGLAVIPLHRPGGDDSSRQPARPPF
ncbi:MAG TPA: transcription-repair coupling factor, partial [Acetobacteraceae bacterium]